MRVATRHSFVQISFYYIEDVTSSSIHGAVVAFTFLSDFDAVIRYSLKVKGYSLTGFTSFAVTSGT